MTPVVMIHITGNNGLDIGLDTYPHIWTEMHPNHCFSLSFLPLITCSLAINSHSFIHTHETIPSIEEMREAGQDKYTSQVEYPTQQEEPEVRKRYPGDTHRQDPPHTSAS